MKDKIKQKTKWKIAISKKTNIEVSFEKNPHTLS